MTFTFPTSSFTNRFGVPEGAHPKAQPQRGEGLMLTITEVAEIARATHLAVSDIPRIHSWSWSIKNWMGPYQQTPKELLELLYRLFRFRGPFSGSCWRYLGIEGGMFWRTWPLTPASFSTCGTSGGVIRSAWSPGLWRVIRREDFYTSQESQNHGSPPPPLWRRLPQPGQSKDLKNACSRSKGVRRRTCSADREFWKTSSKQWEWEGWWGWWYTIDSLTRCIREISDVSPIWAQHGSAMFGPKGKWNCHIFHASVTGKLVKMGITGYGLHADLPMENAFTLLFPRHVE